MPSLLYGLSSLQTMSLKLFGHKVFGQIVIDPIDLQGMNPVLDDVSLLLFVLGLDHMYHVIYHITQWLTNYSLMLLCLIRFKILEDVTTAIIWTKEKQGTNVWPQRSQTSPFMWEVHETDGAAAFQADTMEQHLCPRDNLPCSTSTFTALQNACSLLIPAPWIRKLFQGQCGSRYIAWCVLCEWMMWKKCRPQSVRLHIEQWGRQRQRPNPRVVLHTDS